MAILIAGGKISEGAQTHHAAWRWSRFHAVFAVRISQFNSPRNEGLAVK
jgi:hypothetical protein